MSLTSTITDIISEANALLSEPVSLDGWQPIGHETETHEQHAAAEDEERERRLQERVRVYMLRRQDGLAFLRAVRAAAHARRDQYRGEADAWARQAQRQARIADYCEQLAGDLLRTERRLAGYTDDEPYLVQLPNGVTVGLKLNPPSVEIYEPREVPPELYDEPKPPQPSRSRIADVLRTGLPVPGELADVLAGAPPQQTTQPATSAELSEDDKAAIIAAEKAENA